MPFQPDTIAAVNNTCLESLTKLKPIATIPPKSQTLPYPATGADIPKLEQYLKDAFKDTTLIDHYPFPAMTGPPLHIRLKPDALTYT